MQGTLVIVSGHSGAGKTTIVGKCVAKGVGARVITCTTRPPRAGEVSGKDYRFFSKKEFVKRLKRGEFAEHAEVYGNFYGTLAADIDLAQKTSPIAFLIVDVQGAKTLTRKYPEARSIFIAIPRNELEKRLVKRGDAHEDIERRMAVVNAEIAKTGIFDEVVNNKTAQLDAAVHDFLSVIKKYRAEERVVPKHAALRRMKS